MCGTTWDIYLPTWLLYSLLYAFVRSLLPRQRSGVPSSSGTQAFAEVGVLALQVRFLRRVSAGCLFWSPVSEVQWHPQDPPRRLRQMGGGGPYKPPNLGLFYLSTLNAL